MVLAKINARGNFISNSTHQTCQRTSKLSEVGELRERQISGRPTGSKVYPFSRLANELPHQIYATVWGTK